VSLPETRAHRLAGAALIGAAATEAAQAAFGVQLARPAVLVALPAVAAVLLLASLRLGPARRRRLATAVVAALVAAYGVEYALGRSQPRDGTLAARRGVRFDTRTRWDVVHDERRAGKAAYPTMEPRLRLTPEATRLPLGGIAGKTTVSCNEGGSYAIYESDEHGFNNPKGLWGRGAADVGIVGEAFAQGACVPAGAGAADRIRERYPVTLNLGMSGNGPLLELGGLIEHLAPVKPRIVLWFYYNHDLGSLAAERGSPLLRRYLEGDTTQGLATAQEAIDRDLGALADRIEAGARVWPARLGSLGLTRSSTPMWLQDLVMGEQHSSASVVLRLDRLNGFAATHLAIRPAAAAPGGSGGRPDLAVYKAILGKAKTLVSAWGGTMYFVYLADVHNLSGPEHPGRRPILATVKELGLPLIDVQPAFAAVPDPMTLRYHAESHCNEAGYQLIADTVLAALPPP
jgi:hypothetical protein